MPKDPCSWKNTNAYLNVYISTNPDQMMTYISSCILHIVKKVTDLAAVNFERNSIWSRITFRVKVHQIADFKSFKIIYV